MKGLRRGIKLKVFKSNKDLCDAVCQHILVRSRERIFAQGYFSLVLSGGATPKGVYERMTKAPYRNQFKWERMHFFWGDERWVHPGHPRSNFRMVSETLLKRVKVPRENIHSIKTTNIDPAASCELYEKEVIAYFGLEGGGFPRFDLVLLGVGEDGHVASLFPGQSALKERRRWVLPVESPKLKEKRLTITFPVLNHADEMLLLVSGKKKAKVVKKLSDPKKKSSSLPVRRLRLRRSNVFLYTDRAAASLVSHA